MAANETTLGALHAAVTQHLLAKIEAGEATASELAVAVKLLKDNNITCLPQDDNVLGELEQKLQARKSKRTTVSQADIDAAMAQMEFLQ